MTIELQSPCFFAGGVPRSGTTLLQRMLDAHPQLAVANDTHYIPDVIADFPVDVNPPLTPKLVDDVLAYRPRRIKRLKLAPDVIRACAKGADTYAAFVVNVFREYARLHNKPIAAEKTTEYALHMIRLHHLFPWARFLHIVRDGREVAASVREWGNETKGPGVQHPDFWREEPIGLIALWWQWFAKKAMADGEKLGSGFYMQINYHELVDDAESVLRRICQFINLPYSERMVEFHKGKAIYDKNLSAKKAWLPATKGVRNWHSDLSEREIALFEALAGDLLTKLGFELSVAATSPSVLREAENCRQRWNAQTPAG